MGQYQTSVNELLRSAMAYKESLIKRHGVSAEGDLPLTALLSNGSGGFAMVAPLTDVPDDVRQVLAYALSLTDCDCILLITDSYSYSSSRSEAGSASPEELQGASLQEWFAEGRPGVSEALTIARWTRQDTVSHVMVPYRVEVGRVVIWGPQEGDLNAPHDGPIAGALHDAIRHGFDLQTNRPCAPARTWRELRSWCPPYVAMVMAPMSPPRAARNLPCPCGSGLKAKRCCG